MSCMPFQGLQGFTLLFYFSVSPAQWLLQQHFDTSLPTDPGYRLWPASLHWLYGSFRRRFEWPWTAYGFKRFETLQVFQWMREQFGVLVGWWSAGLSVSVDSSGRGKYSEENGRLVSEKNYSLSFNCWLGWDWTTLCTWQTLIKIGTLIYMVSGPLVFLWTHEYMAKEHFISGHPTHAWDKYLWVSYGSELFSLNEIKFVF